MPITFIKILQPCSQITAAHHVYNKTVDKTHLCVHVLNTFKVVYYIVNHVEL